MPLESWLEIAAESHFSIANIPFGIISHAACSRPHAAIAIGEYALDLGLFARGNGFSALSTIQPHQSVFSEETLNAFAALGKPIHAAVRKYLQSVLLKSTPFPHILKDNEDLKHAALVPLRSIQTHMPMRIGDYTDFYAGLHHAETVGTLFRGAANALQPNYKHLPVGYHGRASSIVVSGTSIRRPHGQILDARATDKLPDFSPSKKLDFELELGAFICKENIMGEPVPLNNARDHIFGLVLLNDWSARDIQAWEYVPLGPFNGKNFGTTISPWVVLTDALEPFRTTGLPNDSALLPYLQESDTKNLFDISLEVSIKTSSGHEAVVTKVNGSNLLFSFEQMLAHHTVGGCPVGVGDLLGSGTISGPERSTMGCLLEQTENGKRSIKVGSQEKTFLDDGDTVVMRGWSGSSEEGLVGFGDSHGTILPALKLIV